ncbi:RipA family octameric membrane protein [Tessaracoccus caeni]|uniref:RipA family octameric membrane protein n=1 Tax=Tessaracoccus caeni TaxID=3031239 RepID=UPI0023DB457D|nr:hypothetical protein [Tessaracoccus caeni]MDF1489344.1 hypothetical protein [Tessaracoccus caeni]
MSDEASTFDDTLFPNGPPRNKGELDQLIELYKLMVASSETLVSRRQNVNTFFLTINTLLLSASGIVINAGSDSSFKAAGLAIIGMTGGILSITWLRLLKSLGQLNRGKFAVINRLELTLTAAIYLAEWQALGEGKDPKKYSPSTSREAWIPWTFLGLYCLTTICSVAVAVGVVVI